MKNIILHISTWVLFLLSISTIIAQEKWYASSSIQMVGTEFQDGSNHSSFYLYNGLRYQAQNISLGINIPIVFGTNSLESSEDGSLLNNFINSSDHMGGGLSSLEIGLGDIYVYGSYIVLKESSSIPAISIDGYVKFPTATDQNFGTKSMDEQIAIGLKKSIKNISFFGQIGYLFLSESEELNYNNPITISAGVGYFFRGGRHSVIAAYDSYTNIIEGVKSPSQIALGYNYLIRKGLFFTTILSSGLNNSSASYTISGGMNYEL